MIRRKHRIVDCNPRWGEAAGVTCYVIFDCPEGHEGCTHAIPFTPALDGTATQQAGAMWQRTGDTFETLTLSPSIARRPRHKTREEALAAGVLPEYLESVLCALHIFIRDGAIEFCGDSK